MKNEELAIVWKLGNQRQKNRALKKILKNNRGIIHKAGLSMKLDNYRSNHEADFYQIACLYVMQALDTYERDRGTLFYSWLAWRLKAAQNHYFKILTTVRGRTRELPCMISLNEKVPGHRDNVEYIDLMPSPATEFNQDRIYLETMSSVLNPDEQKIINEYYSELRPALGDLGRKMNLSKERVRQIKEKALSKMKLSTSRPGIFWEIRELYLQNV